jgi:diguanylate cyclase (GGDEF)-like protein
MPLRVLLRLIAALAVTVAGLLVLRIAWIAAQDVARATQARDAVVRLRKALVAAEMVSKERGPTNGMLGEPLPARPERVDALAQARARTDAAWAALGASLADAEPSGPDAAAPTDAARQALRAARADVDAVLARPMPERDPALLRATVAGMVAVVPRLAPVVDGFAAQAQAALPALGEDVQGARLAAELREYAGLLGSHFTAPLARRAAFTPQERLQVERTRGRIDQLRFLLQLRVQGPQRGEAVARDWARVEQHYFGAAMALAGEVIAQGEASGAYAVDPAGFASAYVPDMNTILELRDTMLGQAADAAQAESARAWRVLAAVSAAALLMVAALAVAARVLRRRVLQPLAATVQVLGDLARDEPGGALPEPPANDEIAAVIRGVGTLQAHARVRRALERERDELIERLKSQSATDFLTGLANRRAFFDTAERELAGARRHGVPVVLMMLDIDHFKRLNDAHGHDSGDRALRAVAEAVRSRLRQDDLAARHGGEEFVLLLRHCDRADGLRFAERLREAIAEAPVRLPDGQTLQVTASIGLAASSDHGHGLDTLVTQADQAMYRAKHAGRDQVAMAPPPPAQPPASSTVAVR